MKKSVKIILIYLAVLLIGTILFFVCAFFGNPVSYFLAVNSADNYVEENYLDTDYEVEKIGYDFKSTGYYARVISPSSIDTHFSVYFDLLGRPLRDSFENVTDGWNTYMRLEDEYRALTDKVFEEVNKKFTSDISFGEIKTFEYSDGYKGKEPYGIVMSELELDYEYDIKEVAKSAGHLVFYYEETELTAEKSAERLLELKEIFDKHDMPFYAIDFTAQEPKTETNAGNQAEFSVNEFLYSDIYEEGLAERLQAAADDLKRFYSKEDAK